MSYCNNNPLKIKELLGLILSFIPRRDIHLCVSTCKSFYESIPIIHDQQIVAELGDVYSLKKIVYSPYVVAHISCHNGNAEMANHVLGKLINSIDYRIFVDLIKGTTLMDFGYFGNENLLKRLSNVTNDKYAIIFMGICKGGHINLFDDYIKYCVKEPHIFWAIVYTFSSDNVLMHHKVTEHFEHLEIIFKSAKLYGTFSHPNKIKMKQLIEDIIKNHEFNDTILLSICGGLLLGGHFDIFMWLQNKKLFKTKCIFNIPRMIIKFIENINNFKTFEYLFLNHFDYKNDDYNMDDLIMWAIHHKNVNVLKLLLEYIHFDNLKYECFMKEAIRLKFDDIVKVFEQYV